MSERNRRCGHHLALAAIAFAIFGACVSRPSDPTPLVPRLSVVTQPAGITSGQRLSAQPVVELLDSGGVRMSGATDLVTATLATGTGTTEGRWTVAAVDGVATFSTMALTGTGAFTLRFTSGALAEAVSSPFTLAAPPAPRTLLIAAVTSVLTYDLAVGTSLGTFASGGALAFPYDAVLGPDGYLYVAEYTNQYILRLDPQSGAGRGIFASLSTTATGRARRCSAPTAACTSPTGRPRT
jgi:hypothetical protein